MVSVYLPSDALLQHLPSYLGFSYLGRGVSLHGCSSKVQPLLFTLDEGCLLMAAPPDLECRVASVFVRSILFLSFIVPMFAWNVPLISLIFLKRSLVFLILLFSSISLHWLLRKAFLSLLAILWNSAFKWEYLSFSPLLFTSFLFTAICKASSDKHFDVLHLFFLGTILIPVSCTMSGTSIHIYPYPYLSISSGILRIPQYPQVLCLLDLIPWSISPTV